MSNQSTAGAALDALGDPVRRAIVERLHRGPLAVGALAEQLPVGRPAVSKHLRVLSDAGLVRHERRGTRNLYALAPPGMVAAQQWLVSMWDTALGSFAAAAESAAAAATATADGRRTPADSREDEDGSADADPA